MLTAASTDRTAVLLWGGGTHQGIGGRVSPGVVLATSRLDRIVSWEPEDLTVVVEAGVRIGDLDDLLAEKGQSAVLPETMPDATVGGVVAGGISGYRRARYGPTRDRVLEVTLVTGDGRIVTGGGQVVKNVSGYDLPRLATASFGGLGLVGRVCLKLWPAPPARFTMLGRRPGRGTIPLPAGGGARDSCRCLPLRRGPGHPRPLSSRRRRRGGLLVAGTPARHCPLVGAGASRPDRRRHRASRSRVGLRRPAPGRGGDRRHRRRRRRHPR